METFLKRDENGNTQVGDTYFKVPKDVSALSILGLNKVENGIFFAEDGRVYDLNTNKKIRKWFTKIEGITVWEPKLSKEWIPKLESLFYKTYYKQKDHFESKERLAIEALEKVDYAHAYYKKIKAYVKYSTRQDEYYGTLISSETLEHKPKQLKNLEIGQKYHDSQKRNAELHRRNYKCRMILDYAIKRAILSNVKADNKWDRAIIVTILINGRTYTYIKEGLLSGYSVGWKAYPWDETTIKTIGV
jgi:hypothetical protein